MEQLTPFDSGGGQNHFPIDKSIETESRLMVTRGWEEEGMGHGCCKFMEFYFGVMKCPGIR